MREQLTSAQITKVCELVNDFISSDASVDVKAVPGDLRVAWVRVYPQGEYPFAQNEAFQRLVQAGYNPQKLLDFAIGKAIGTEKKSTALIATRRARHIAVTEFGWPDTPASSMCIRKAAERGAIEAKRNPIDGWQYSEESLRRWLGDPNAHKPGPRRNSEVTPDN